MTEKNDPNEVLDVKEIEQHLAQLKEIRKRNLNEHYTEHLDKAINFWQDKLRELEGRKHE